MFRCYFKNLENGNNQLYSRINSKFAADSKMLYDEEKNNDTAFA